MIRTLLHHPRDGFSQLADLSALSTHLEDRHNVLWVEVQDPTAEELDLLRREFGFHELALEDADHPHERPKLDEYDNFYFLVFYSLELKPDGGQLQATELDLFVGENYVVAVHRGSVREIEEGLRRWERNHERLGHGVGTLVYSLIDSLVDGYFQVSDGLAERVTGLEERVVAGTEPRAVKEIFLLKKHLLAMRRILGPERDALNVLMRQDLSLLDRRTLVYLRDVYDHLVRITDTVDLHSDLVTNALDVHLSSVSNRLNEVVKTLTSWTIILMSATLIAGIYGMNFHNIPELSWDFGYAYSLAVMLVLAGALYFYFRRRGWL